MCDVAAAMNRLVYLFYLNLLFVPLYRNVDGQIPSTVLCVDKECNDIISTAITHLKYNKAHSYMLSFKPNTKVNVLAKPENAKDELWGVEIEGAYGYVPKQFLRENKIKNTVNYQLKGEEFLYLKEKLIKKMQKEYDKMLNKGEPQENFDKKHRENEDVDMRTVHRKTSYKDNPLNDVENGTERTKLKDKAPKYDDQPPADSKKKDFVQDPWLEKPIYPNERDRRKIDPDEQLAYKRNLQQEEMELNELNNQYLKYSANSKITPDNRGNKPSEYPPTQQTPEATSESVSLEIVGSSSPEIASSENVSDKTASVELSSEIVSTENPNAESASSENSKSGEVRLEDILSWDNASSAEASMEFISGEDSSEDQSGEYLLSGEVNADTQNISDQASTESTSAAQISSSSEIVSENTFNASEESLTENILNVKNVETTQATKIDDGIINLENNVSLPNLINENITGLDSNVSETSLPAETILENSLPSEKISTELPLQGFDYTGIHNQIKVNDNFDDKNFPNNAPPENELPSIEKPEVPVLNDTMDSNIYQDNISEVIKDKEFEDNTKNLSYLDNKEAHVEVGEKTGDHINPSIDHVHHYHHHHQDGHMNVESAYTPPPSHLPPQLPLFQANSFGYFSGGQVENSVPKITTEGYNDYYETKKEYIEITTEIPVEFNDVSDKLDEIKPDPFVSSNNEPNGEASYAENQLPEDMPVSSSIMSLKILSDMYDSISNVFKSNNNVNNPEDAMMNSDFLKDDQDKLSSLFTEPSQCSLDDKPKISWSDVSADLVFWLVTSAISVLMFTLGYYYLDNRKEDGKLLAMVNSLQKELLCSSKECIILKEELTITKEKLTGIEDNSFGSNEMVVSLKNELAEAEQRIVDLQERLGISEEELANSTEAAFELQSILDEQLTSNEKSNSLAFTVTQLQSQLDDQQATMTTTKSQLAGKIEENEFLMMQISEVNNRHSKLRQEVDQINESLAQAVEESEKKSLRINELTATSEKSMLHLQQQNQIEVKTIQLQLENTKTELNNVQANLKARIHEVQSLQDSIKALKLDEKNIKELLDVTRVKADLVQTTSEKSLLTEKVENDQKTISELMETLSTQNANFAKMKEQLTESENKSLEATTRLEVLTNYFNQKEAELLKELSTKESLWISQQGEAMSTTERIESIQKEIQQYKDTAESTRRELAEQEAAWRTKAAALEQRAHDQWLARRAAERQAEASAREAQALRQRLAAPSPDKRVISPLTAGEPLPDPSFMPPLGALGAMLPPPLPPGFLPPPMMLPPPQMFPHRPAPLGRLSSPPPLQPRSDRYSDSRYSPDRPYSPSNRRSPFSNSEDRRRGYNDRRYDDDRYYDSEEDRRSRRYETETDFSPVNTLPPSPIPTPRNHKGVSSGSGQSYESIERFK